MTSIVLLGPQRLEPNVRDILASLSIGNDHPVAAITAGWEDREPDDLELGEHLGRPVVNLQLHGRGEQVLQQDPELFAAVQQRHDALRQLQDLYRLQLRYLVPATQRILRRKAAPDILLPEQEFAFEQLRGLDAHHSQRVQEIQTAFLNEMQLDQRPSLAHARDEIRNELGNCGALLIAGGHVGILYNRLWFFDIPALLPKDMPVLAWSAGAMAISEQIVLFHDTPPQGKGHAETIGPGLGLCPGVIALPHARRRLALEDPVRVELLARRFPNAMCVALDEQTAIRWDGEAWMALSETNRLTDDGALAPIGASGNCGGVR